MERFKLAFETFTSHEKHVSQDYRTFRPEKKIYIYIYISYSITLSKFGHGSCTIGSVLRPSLTIGSKRGEWEQGGGEDARHRRGEEILRGDSGEKTVSKAQIVSPFPEERCTVHLETFRLPVTARARQLLIRYTQNASYLFSVSISSSVSLFRGDVNARSERRPRKSESSFSVTIKMSEGIEDSSRRVINVSRLGEGD